MTNAIISRREYKGYELIKKHIYANIFIWHINIDNQEIAVKDKLSLCKKYIDNLINKGS